MKPGPKPKNLDDVLRIVQAGKGSEPAELIQRIADHFSDPAKPVLVALLTRYISIKGLQCLQENVATIGAYADEGDGAMSTAEHHRQVAVKNHVSPAIARYEEAITRILKSPGTVTVCQSQKCVGNGQIEVERLIAVPEATTCAACARATEAKPKFPSIRRVR